MVENNSKNRKSVINIGTSLMVVILIGLSFAVIAALAISSSKNNLDLSDKLGLHTKNYYEASNKVERMIAADKWSDQTYDMEIDDGQSLHVEVKDHQIVCWQVENNAEWDGDESITVHIDEGMGF